MPWRKRSTSPAIDLKSAVGRTIDGSGIARRAGAEGTGEAMVPARCSFAGGRASPGAAGLRGPAPAR